MALQTLFFTSKLSCKLTVWSGKIKQIDWESLWEQNYASN